MIGAHSSICRPIAHGTPSFASYFESMEILIAELSLRGWLRVALIAVNGVELAFQVSLVSGFNPGRIMVEQVQYPFTHVLPNLVTVPQLNHSTFLPGFSVHQVALSCRLPMPLASSFIVIFEIDWCSDNNVCMIVQPGCGHRG